MPNLKVLPLSTQLIYFKMLQPYLSLKDWTYLLIKIWVPCRVCIEREMSEDSDYKTAKMEVDQWPISFFRFVQVRRMPIHAGSYGRSRRRWRQWRARTGHHSRAQLAGLLHSPLHIAGGERVQGTPSAIARNHCGDKLPTNHVKRELRAL